MKTASFVVRASMEQSIRWKKSAEGASHPSVGSWLAHAADAYLRQLAESGRPRPLAWRQGLFRVRLLDGETIPTRGMLSVPFGIFRGTVSGPGYYGCHVYSLVYVPTGRILATLTYMRDCKALAAELAALWVRWDGEGEPPSSEAGTAAVLETYRRKPR